MSLIFEEIKPWDGSSGTGADARAVLKRNFDKIIEAFHNFTPGGDSSFPTTYLTTPEAIDANLAPGTSGVMLAANYLDWGVKGFTLLTLPFGGSDANQAQVAFFFNDTTNALSIKARWGLHSTTLGDVWVPWQTMAGGTGGDVTKSYVDQQDLLKADKVTFVAMAATAPEADLYPEGTKYYNSTEAKIYTNGSTLDVDYVWISPQTPSAGILYIFENKNYFWQGTNLIEITSKSYVDQQDLLKVDKVAGKGLSTNDYSNTAAALVAKIINKADVVELLSITTAPTATAETVGKLYYQLAFKSLEVGIETDGVYEWETYGDALPGTIYTFSGKNYVWNGTDLVDPTAIPNATDIPYQTTNVDAVLDQILGVIAIAPTYTAPTSAITLVPATTSYELGETFNLAITQAFNQNDAGAKQSETGLRASAPYAVVPTTSFNGTVTYAEGAIKNNNLGIASPTGHIAAGTVTSPTKTIAGYRKMFYGCSAPVGTSAQVRALSTNFLNPVDNTSKSLVIPVGATSVAFCYPKSLGLALSIKDALNIDVKAAFTITEVEVEGANAYAAVTYYCYLFTPPTAFGQANNYTIVI